MPALASPPIREGEIIEGKFLIERVLGQGGMGIVVGAQHLQLDQRVAIKFLLSTSAEAVERFLREARAAVRLKSEHVCRVIDVGKLHTGEPFMVMEHLEGHDLGAELDQRGMLPVQEAVDRVVEACEAIAEAHSMGIVHRDLKPQNLFLTVGIGGRLTVKVLDFGISKLMDGQSGSMTQTASVMGSPVYMAPEQMRSAKSAVPASDVWALGVVLQELLTGHVPFDAEALTELALKVVGDPPRPITQDRTDVPEGIVAIVSRCLEKTPSARFANAAELAEALAPFASSAVLTSVDRARLFVSASGTPGSRRLPTPSGPPSRREPVSGVAATVLDGRQGKHTFTNPSLEGSKRGTSGGVLLGVGLVVAAGLAGVGYLLTRPTAVSQASEPASAAHASADVSRAPAAPSRAPAPASTPAPEIVPVAASSAAPPPHAATATTSSAARGKGVVPPKGAPRPTDDDLPSVR